MGKYIVKRILQGFLTCLILVTIVFFLTRISGDPTIWMISPKASGEVRLQIMAKYGLDKSGVEQYFYYIANIFRGDFGTSYFYNRPAMQVVFERLPVTLKLTGTALGLAIMIGIPIGVYSAAKKGSAFDVTARGVAFFTIAAPSFWIGLMLIYIFAVQLKALPAGGNTAPGAIILPSVTLALTLVGSILRLTRTGMMDELNNDYVKLARAKGASEGRVIWRHAFKNATIPVITMIMLLMVVVLSGDVVIENIFSWNGAGRLVMAAVFARDYPIVQAFTIFIGVSFVIISIIADILYAVVNPKIRY